MSSPAAGRMPGAQRRRQLLDVATRVFGRAGYHDASMTDIATAAGVTKPVLYQHFSSKEQLFHDVVAEVGRHMRDTIAKATADATGPRDQVERGFGAFVAFIAEQPDGFRMLFSDTARADPLLHAEVRAVEDAVAGQIADLLDPLAISATDRLVLAHGLVAMAAGASRYWDAIGRPISPGRLADLLIGQAWTGLRGG